MPKPSFRILDGVIRAGMVVVLIVSVLALLLQIPSLAGYHALAVVNPVPGTKLSGYDLVYYREVDPSWIEKGDLIACSIHDQVISVLRVSEIGTRDGETGFYAGSFFRSDRDVRGRVNSIHIPFAGALVEYGQNRLVWLGSVLVCIIWLLMNRLEDET